MTYGGYSESIVVDEAFVLRVRTNWIWPEPRRCSAPAITTYSPLRHWKVSKGQKVGIVGLGGLGHMGVKFANAFGARSCCSPPRQTRRPTGGASARTKWWSQKMTRR